MGVKSSEFENTTLIFQTDISSMGSGLPLTTHDLAEIEQSRSYPLIIISFRLEVINRERMLGINGTNFMLSMLAKIIKKYGT